MDVALGNATLENTMLRNAEIEFSDGGDLAEWPGADLRNAKLRNVFFCQCDLSRVSLAGAVLESGEVCSANLRGADLCGADLSNVSLYAIDLADALYDEATIWPEGFTPPGDAQKVN